MSFRAERSEVEKSHTHFPFPPPPRRRAGKGPQRPHHQRPVPPAGDGRRGGQLHEQVVPPGRFPVHHAKRFPALRPRLWPGGCIQAHDAGYPPPDGIRVQAHHGRGHHETAGKGKTRAGYARLRAVRHPGRV